MAENSKIEWTDHTFNPWRGCAKVSEACRNCYAEALAKRTGHGDLWRGDRLRTRPAYWKGPLKWNRDAQAEGKPALVFCASMADVFELYGEGLEESEVIRARRTDMAEWRTELFQLIRETPWLIWLLLTKRPHNIPDMLPDDWGQGYPNVWLGATVENQDRAYRVPELLEVPAELHFVSVEPMSSALDLNRIRWEREELPDRQVNALTGEWVENGGESGTMNRIRWVIAGGESGGKAKPSHPDWFRQLRDDCAEAGTPFLFKQWGEWSPGNRGPGHDLFLLDRTRVPSGFFTGGEVWNETGPNPSRQTMDRLGKKDHAGDVRRRLDGLIHHEFPPRPAVEIARWVGDDQVEINFSADGT